MVNEQLLHSFTLHQIQNMLVLGLRTTCTILVSVTKSLGTIPGTAWKFVWSNFAGKRRRQVLLEEFQDPAKLSDDICSECCDVYEKKSENELDLTDLK